jgi:enoyl-CoA hydratase
VSEDDTVRAVVLTSTHERVLSAGANLGGFAADAPLVRKHFGTERFPELFRLLGELAKGGAQGTLPQPCVRAQ